MKNIKDKKIYLITHRGLNLTNANFFPESSFESFRQYIKKDYSIELDIRFCKDEIIVSHDSNLKRLCGINKEIKDMYFKELKDIRYGKNNIGKIATLNDVLKMIDPKKNILCAIHIKGDIQSKYNLELLYRYLKKHKSIMKSLLIFDLYPEAAKYLKEHLPKINLGCSISNQSDIKKYNKKVFNTLFALDDAISYKRKGLYNWAIIDEWESSELKDISENLYTSSTFDLMQKEGFHILVISPELHEAHEDNQNIKKLFKRIDKILNLYPNAICTNYPDEVYKYIKQKGGYKFK